MRSMLAGEVRIIWTGQRQRRAAPSYKFCLCYYADTVMAYKARNKIGRFADDARDGETSAALPSDLTVGARVKVTPATERDFERIGTVKFVGSADFAPGVWIGVHYDEPVGKNDGSVEGKRYFECPSKYGGLVKPERCQAGNWASLDDELGLDSD